MKRIQLSDHFTYSRLICFVLPSIAMMIFTSVYIIVDGLFISNFSGKIAFAAINLIYPAFAVLASFGLMIGSGAAAIVALTLGEGRKKEANRYFSMFIYIAIGSGSLLAVLGYVFLRPIAVLLGAQGKVLENCIIYGRWLLWANPFLMLQYIFQIFFVVAEKPRLGLYVTVAAGLTNVVLDGWWVAALGYGVGGAALATAASQVVGGLVPILYFAGKNNSLLRLGKTSFYGRIFLKACGNGFSEFLSNTSVQFVAMLYNYRLIRMVGESGVVAYGVLTYLCFIFASVFMGYSMGIAPAVSFHYGAENPSELKNLVGKSLRLISCAAVFMGVFSFLLAPFTTSIFVGYDKELYDLTLHGTHLYDLCFLLMGYNIYTSSLFTALNNGRISAAVSFLRALVLQVIFIHLLPELLGLDGVWLATVFAEGTACIISFFFLITGRKKYQY